MAIKPRMEPLLFTNTLLILVVLLQLTVLINNPYRAAIPAPSPSVVARPDFSLATQKATEALQRHDYELAHAQLLTAARIDPSDSRLIDAIVLFIETTIAVGTDESLSLAEDMLDRGEALVYFQHPDRVANSQIRIAEARNKLPQPPPSPPPPLEAGASRKQAIHRLLIAANDEARPVDIRIKAASRASAEIEAATLDAIAAPDDDATLSAAQTSSLQQQATAAETKCVAALFNQKKSAAEGWIASAKTLFNATKDKDLTGMQAQAGNILAKIEEGAKHQQELASFVSAATSGAMETAREVETWIGRLQKLHVWRINLHAIDAVRYVEKEKTQTAARRIQELLKIDETQLNAYAAGRVAAAWEATLAEFPDDLQKLEAMKARMLNAAK